VGTFFKDDTYEFMMNIALGATHHRGVDIGESLSATASMGQGVALFFQGLYFRPDWAKVLTPVVDFALGGPEVDPERVTIQGVSRRVLGAPCGGLRGLYVLERPPPAGYAGASSKGSKGGVRRVHGGVHAIFGVCALHAEV
jgi:hypothetical protein